MKHSILVALLAFIIIFSAGAISSDYYYSKLEPTEKQLYDEISNCVMGCIETIDGVSHSKEDCLRIYNCYLNDHPGVFWAKPELIYSTYISGDGSIKHRIKLSYSHQSSLKEDQVLFVQMVSKFHNYIKDENDWMKLFFIYDYLAKNITYNNNYMDQSMWSVFFNGIGVCAGFARSFQYLALMENIPCIIVTGYEKDNNGNPGTVGHAWCMAQIDGHWYHFDPTWGLIDSNGNVDFTYFCRSTDRILLTHFIDNNYPIPKSGNDTLSYAFMRQRFMNTYSREQFTRILVKALSNSEYCMTVEFPDKSELDKAYSDLILNNGLSQIVADFKFGFSSYIYSVNNQAYFLKISFPSKK